MRIVYSLAEFSEEVGIIMDYVRILELGLPLGISLVGTFFRKRPASPTFPA